MQDNDDLESPSSSTSTSGTASAAPVPGIPVRSAVAQLEKSEKLEYDPSAPASMFASPSDLITNSMREVRFVMALVAGFYTVLIVITVVLAIALLMPDILYALDQNSPILMNTARVLIALVAFALGAVALIVGLAHVQINERMQEKELLIDDLRDQILIQLQAARFNLEDLTERLRVPKEATVAGPLEYIEIAKQIGPMISLLLNKERSILTLGVEGLKFFQLIKKVLNK